MAEFSQDRNQIDRLLLEGWKEGKKECYDALYQHYVQPIYRFIYHMVHQRELAEDLTQETFIKLYHNAHLYRPSGAFSSWLYQIARNLTLNYLRNEMRREKRIQMASASDLTPSPESVMEMEQILKDEQIRPDDVAGTAKGAQLLKLVKEALSQLSERDRQLITLCAMNKLPQKEAAQILNCSVLSVKVGLHRARERLMKIIGVDSTKLSET